MAAPVSVTIQTGVGDPVAIGPASRGTWARTSSGAGRSRGDDDRGPAAYKWEPSASSSRRYGAASTPASAGPTSSWTASASTDRCTGAQLELRPELVAGRSGAGIRDRRAPGDARWRARRRPRRRRAPHRGAAGRDAVARVDRLHRRDDRPAGWRAGPRADHPGVRRDVAGSCPSSCTAPRPARRDRSTAASPTWRRPPASQSPQVVTILPTTGILPQLAAVTLAGSTATPLTLGAAPGGL